MEKSPTDILYEQIEMRLLDFGYKLHKWTPRVRIEQDEDGYYLESGLCFQDQFSMLKAVERDLVIKSDKLKNVLSQIEKETPFLKPLSIRYQDNNFRMFTIFCSFTDDNLQKLFYDICIKTELYFLDFESFKEDRRFRPYFRYKPSCLVCHLPYIKDFLVRYTTSFEIKSYLEELCRS